MPDKPATPQKKARKKVRTVNPDKAAVRAVLPAGALDRADPIAELFGELSDLDTDRPVDVMAFYVGDLRSHAQNRLYWMWMNVVAGVLSDTGSRRDVSKDYAHGWCKKEILLPILMRDENPQIAREAKWWAKVISELRHEVAQVGVAKDCVRSCDESKERFSAYLRGIEQWADDYMPPIQLPKPDELYAQAEIEQYINAGLIE